MPLVKPLSKRRARCEDEALGDARFPVVPRADLLRSACAKAWGRAPEWTLLGVRPHTDESLEAKGEILATTVLEGGWTFAWSGTLLNRALSVALRRSLDPVELRRPPTRFDCGAAAWILTRLLTDWLGEDAPGILSFEPGWCPPRTRLPWRLDLRWRCWERGRGILLCPWLPDAVGSESALSAVQQRRMAPLPIRLRPELTRLELSPGALEALRPGDLLPLPRLHWRDRGLVGPILLKSGSLHRQAWLEHPLAPAAPMLRIGARLGKEVTS